jgi:hypothetical protein
MISRIVKTKDYSVISNAGLNDARLSLKAKGLYAYLLSKPDDWVITKAGLETQLKEGREAIKSALAELEQCEYIKRERVQGDHGHISTVTTLYETPSAVMRETRTSENPADGPPVRIVSTDLPSTEEVSTEILVPTEQGAEPKVFGDPQVNDVVGHFEKKIGLMPRMEYQRRAAKTLIQRHGFEKVIGGINAVAASRGEPYAPTISSLVALRDKWIDLETFYRRTQSKQNQKKGLMIA